MSRYDGLIIPRSYSEYINKTDAATLLQALQLSGVMDAAPTQNSNKPVKSSGIFNAINPTYFLTRSQTVDKIQAIVGGIYLVYYSRGVNTTHGILSGASVILEQYSASNIAYIAFVKATNTVITMQGESNFIYYKRLA